MPIYLLFLQHIIYSLSEKGKAAVVVPTGFLTAQDKISKEIRAKLVNLGFFAGAISMPSNIFATTGTNVSVVILDKSTARNSYILIDATKLGTSVKEGKNQKTLLSEPEEDLIVETFSKAILVEEFSVTPDKTTMAKKSYSFSAGQYFPVKHMASSLSEDEFEKTIAEITSELSNLFKVSREGEKNLLESMKRLKLNEDD